MNAMVVAPVARRFPSTSPKQMRFSNHALRRKAAEIPTANGIPSAYFHCPFTRHVASSMLSSNVTYIQPARRFAVNWLPVRNSVNRPGKGRDWNRCQAIHDDSKKRGVWLGGQQPGSRNRLEAMNLLHDCL